MFKSILAVLGGTAVGVFTIGLVQYLGHQLYTTPTNTNLEATEAAGAYLASAPIGALLMVLFAYALGSLFGGMVAARYSPAKPIFHALVVGAVLMLSGIANFMSIPHPLWFIIVSLLLFLPMAFFGGMMSSRRIP
ncbi:MAG: hypothetical protein ACO1OQ_04150 [Rufibacter sp.]